VISNRTTGFPPAPGSLSQESVIPRIRYGNLWDRNLGTVLAKPEFVAGMKLLAAPGWRWTAQIPRRAHRGYSAPLDRVPNLRIVIDHLPQMAPITEASVGSRTS